MAANVHDKKICMATPIELYVSGLVPIYKGMRACGLEIIMDCA
jgi:hypothetical protein